MNTIDSLRSTLDQHADELHDSERYVRAGAVHARVVAVRRRRTAAISVVAAVVLVAGVVTAVNLRSSDGPGPSVVAGQEVAQRIEVNGFPYTRVASMTFGDGDRLKSDDGDGDRAAVLVATGLGSGSATLYAGDHAVARVLGTGGSSAPVLIGDNGADLRVRLDGTDQDAQVGAVVYEETGELAPGVANADGTSVFRDRVADQPLVAGGFAAPGDDELTFPLSGDATDVRFAYYCTADDDVYVNVEVDGQGVTATSCGGAFRDAGTGTSTSFDEALPGQEHQVRVFLTRDGDEIPADGIEFGLGVYALDPVDQVVAGSRIPTVVEYQGRTWELSSVGERGASIETASTDVLLGFAAVGRRVNATWHGRLLDGGDGSVTLQDGGSTYTAGLLLAGDTYSIDLKGEITDGALLFYDPR